MKTRGTPEGELHSEVTLRALEPAQRRGLSAVGGLSVAILLTTRFVIPATINGILIVAFRWVSPGLDGRIRALGGRAESFGSELRFFRRRS